MGDYCGIILIERSPMALITGLGAFAAVLMLIFKDSILGFVAGVQLSQNDMIRNGDWIVVPGGAVNGVVIRCFVEYGEGSEFR